MYKVAFGLQKHLGQSKDHVEFIDRFYNILNKMYFNNTATSKGLV